MHRVFGAQAGEVVLPAVLAEEVGVERVDLVQAQLIRRRHIGGESSLLDFRAAVVPPGEPLIAFGLDIGHDLLLSPTQVCRTQAYDVNSHTTGPPEMSMIWPVTQAAAGDAK